MTHKSKDISRESWLKKIQKIERAWSSWGRLASQIISMHCDIFNQSNRKDHPDQESRDDIL